MFTEERISAEAFAKGEVIDEMLKNVEMLFTEHFEHGDTKKARDRLRKQDYVATVTWPTYFTLIDLTDHLAL